LKKVYFVLLSFSILPVFAQESSFNDSQESDEKYEKMIERIENLENQSHIHTYPVLGYFGILLSFAGFIFMLRYWSHPYERHLENWIKIIVVLYPKSYQNRIKRDFNYWRDYRDKGKPSPYGEWYVPKGFAWYWHIMKLFSFFSIIVGFFLQIIQLGFL